MVRNWRFSNSLFYGFVFLMSYWGGLLQSKAQLGVFQKESDAINPFHEEQVDLFFKNNFNLPSQRVGVNSARLYVRTDFSNQYQFGEPGNGADFKFTIHFNLVPLGNNDLDTLFESLTIANNQPVAYYHKILNHYVKQSANGFTISGFRLMITDVDVEGLPDGISDKLKIYLGYEATYQINPEDIDLVVNKIALKEGGNAGNTKTVQFSWSQVNIPPVDVPGFELQLLKLCNDVVNNFSEKPLSLAIDWSKALSYYVEKPYGNEAGETAKDIYLTIGQGAGLYVWRVRPIGTRVPNGIGDSRNWGAWDVDAPKTGVVELSGLTMNGNYHFFNFFDPDEGKNYSYNRLFSEEGKTKEKTTYATQLQNIRQEQVYLPSEDITIFSQTLQDKKGRNAISTIGVPKQGKAFKYEEGLTQTQDYKFYRVEQYDIDQKLKDPNKMNQGTGNIFNYYTDEHADGRIPVTEGYPFSRTLYATDGTNRPTEVSGVGRVHSIGSQSNGRGRTTKVYYGSVAETELTRLFGDEAPNPKYIQKTINTDQNNTTSVTYTTLDGKIIATGLVFTEEEDGLLSLDKEAKITEVTNSFSTNIVTQSAFSSTKKLVLTQKTALAITYRLKCKTLIDLCTDGGVSCGYKLRFTVYNHTGEKVFSSTDTKLELKSEDCRDELFETEITTQELEPGEYLVEKKLFKDTINVTVPVNNLKAELEPIAQWIRERIDSAVCFNQLLDFYNELIPYSRLHQQTPVKVTVFDENKIPMDLDDLPITQFNTPASVLITNSCCEIALDVSCFPPFTCPTNQEIVDFMAAHPNGLDHLKVNFNYHDDPENTTFLYDFEGYAVSLIRQCNASLTIDEAKERLYGNMIGWQAEGTFNRMVYHMLTDKYSFGGFGANSQPGNCHTPASKLLPDSMGGEPLCNPDLNNPMEGVRYQCFEVMQCWENMVQQFIQYDCKGERMDSIFNQSGKTIAELFDEQNNGDQSVYDNHFNDGFKGFFLIKWLAKRKISKELRKESVNVRIKPSQVLPLPQYNSHLVHGFLKCTGYQFADILNPAHEDYPKNNLATGDFSPYALDSCFYSIEEDFIEEYSRRKYNPQQYFKNHFHGIETVEEWENQKVKLNKDETVLLKELFPLIKHPEYAFKYFEYEYGSDNALEAVNCFRDPNICEDANGAKIPCCGALANGDPRPCTFSGAGRINCPFTANEWTTDQRQVFYQKLTERIPLYGPNGDPQDMEVWSDGNDEVNCAWLELERTWVRNKKDDRSPVAMEYIPVPWFEKWFENETPFIVLFRDIGGNGVTQISMMEIEALNMTKTCNSGCDGRREEFKQAVTKMFLDRCYVIDECKVALEDNVVPLEDIEIITDSLIKKCQNTCRITTYTCDDLSPCRTVSSSIRDLGTFNDGNNDHELKVRLGVGGSGDCPTQERDMLNCTGDTTLSYQEYILWLMGKNWNLDLEIPSKCNEAGVYDPNYHGPNWYWYNNQKLEIYNPPPCATPGDDPTVDEALGNPYIIPRSDGEVKFIRKKSAAIDVHVEVGN